MVKVKRTISRYLLKTLLTFFKNVQIEAVGVNGKQTGITSDDSFKHDDLLTGLVTTRPHSQSHLTT